MDTFLLVYINFLKLAQATCSWIANTTVLTTSIPHSPKHTYKHNMPRGSEYSDEKRAAALIMFLIFKASHSDVEARTGVSKSAVRQMASRAHKAGVDRTSIEGLIVFARTKPRKGRPRRDATDKPPKTTPRAREKVPQSLGSKEALDQTSGPVPPVQTTIDPISLPSGTEDLFEVIKSWNQRKEQAINASYLAMTKEQE
ncbi:hypothetical protein D6D20_02507 [Aureobasidium pullulans]|uniref:Uncharacterized protein n=1 Tax=Aureobasidium pullulans TaxID=5580 RepID=A0A4S8ZGP2_AURPU|nr:hypothetical protein D6D20_02507 [Aureobasidium pullulans]